MGVAYFGYRNTCCFGQFTQVEPAFSSLEINIAPLKRLKPWNGEAVVDAPWKDYALRFPRDSGYSGWVVTEIYHDDMREKK